MRLLLTTNPDLIRNGYINICPNIVESTQENIRDSYINLDRYAEDNEVEDLLAIDALEYLNSDEVNKALTNWFKKIAHNGTLTLECTDLRQVCRAFTKQEIDTNIANILLYGQQKHGSDYKKSMLSINDLLNIFNSFGFQIIRKEINQYTFMIKGQRP